MTKVAKILNFITTILGEGGGERAVVYHSLWACGDQRELSVVVFLFPALGRFQGLVSGCQASPASVLIHEASSSKPVGRASYTRHPV